MTFTENEILAYVQLMIEFPDVFRYEYAPLEIKEKYDEIVKVG